MPTEELFVYEADDLLSAFDPKNEARWLYGKVTGDEPRYDGSGWCRQLPVDSVARDLLLTHYFYTTSDWIHGYKVPPRPKKLVIVARDRQTAESLLDSFDRGLPKESIVQVAFDRTFEMSTFSAVMRAYDIAYADDG